MSGRAFGAVRDNFVRDNAMKWVRARLRDGSVSGGLPARAVLMLLADYPAGQRFPSIARLAAELDCNERTVQRAITSLLADQLIERDIRHDPRTGRSTSSLYRLRIGEWTAEAADDGAPEGDFAPPTRVTLCRGEGGTESPSTTFETTTLASGSSDELPESVVRARDRDRKKQEAHDRAEAAYRLLEGHWLRVAPGRVAEDAARLAFSAAIADGTDPALIAACGMRFLGESPDAKASKVAMLHRWLGDKRWRGWEPKAEAAGNLAPAAGTWRGGDAAFVEAVLRDKAPEWVAAWIDRCDWNEAQREIVAPLGLVRDRIDRELGRLLGEHSISVVVRSPATVDKAA